MSTEDLSQETLQETAEMDADALPEAGDEQFVEVLPEGQAFAPQDEQASAVEPQQMEALGAIAHLPLQLTLRCGQLTLSVDQLRQLGSGSVLEIHGVAPGRASLCHGEYVVGEGELVDVDGRLGLQITRLATLS
ncbi:FliM/FliN family flagellar motor switch protein [Ectopseudomonas alcaliphila]|uniref:FliM/FliN family flagellar motor switch protein n=2 Tax=Ectopseudomonas alcaliphila TaxID=101564 RepID=A0ABU4PYU2_9GAMM|nr:FliM/FliN family flagellar motor switch protein [Pseudomonas alcaliphila]MDX5993087.1 FliM/FliN family flagellar motor switch protein [Pseudomonas alcaliphila]